MIRKILLPAVLLTGCAVGPDYQKPEVPVPTEFRQVAASQGLWKSVRELAEGDQQTQSPWWIRWWNLSAEDELAQYLVAVEKANPNVELLAAQYRQAGAVLAAAKAPWWPSLSTNVSSSRGQGSVSTAGSVSSGGDVRVTDKVGMSNITPCIS